MVMVKDKRKESKSDEAKFMSCCLLMSVLAFTGFSISPPPSYSRCLSNPSPQITLKSHLKDLNLSCGCILCWLIFRKSILTEYGSRRQWNDQRENGGHGMENDITRVDSG